MKIKANDRPEHAMRKEVIEKVIGQLDGMIAVFGQAVVIGGRNTKESEACELLKDARLKLVEDMEARYGDDWQPGWTKIDRLKEEV